MSQGKSDRCRRRPACAIGHQPDRCVSAVQDNGQMMRSKVSGMLENELSAGVVSSPQQLGSTSYDFG
eukprot:2336911-Pleurochrysis_carterae.AAC.7